MSDNVNGKIQRIFKNPTISFDLGYGYVKAMDDNQKISFPTFYKENKGNKVEQKILPDYLVKIYEKDGLNETFSNYAVGEFAKLGKIKKEWGEEQALNINSVKIYMGTALWVLSEKSKYSVGDEGKTHVNLSVGLPLDYYTSQKTALEKLLKDLEIDIEINGVRKIFIVDCSLVSQQGVGAFFDLVFKNDGSAKNLEELTNTISKCDCVAKHKNEFEPKSVATSIFRFGIGISDVGYNTIDSFYVSKKGGNFIIVDESAHSLVNQAMYKTYENASDTINREFDIGLGVFELEEAIKESDNFIKYGKIELNTSEYLEESYKACAEDLQSELDRNWSTKMQKLGAVMFCGGGAYNIAKHFDIDVITLIQEDSAYANARGYLKKIKKLISELETDAELEKEVEKELEEA